MKVVFPDQLDLLPNHKEKIQSLVDLTTYDDHPTEDQAIERIQGAELITVNYIDATKKLIESTPSLKYIVVPAVGYEWVDLVAAKKADIKVLNCPTHNGQAVAEHTIALMFAVARKIVQANLDLKNGEWRPKNLQGVELSGKTIGLIGYGNIGKQTAQIAQALGMEITYANSKTSSSELDTIISQSDFVCLNIPLTPKTKHMIDERRIGLMKKTAFLINTARGAVVDQKALVKALRNNEIAGAGLDVFENEPLTGKPTQEMLELVVFDNVVATPHIGYNTQETVNRLGSELIRNIESCIEGNPINVVSG